MSDSTSPDQRIEIASKFEELESIVDAAEVFYKSCFEEEDRVFTGVLLASEVVTNAIEHGNENDETKKVVIEFRLRDGRSEGWVEDDGEGFEREEIADPLAIENLLEDGGRGIFLIERMADEVVYENGGRRVGVILNV